jgi:hypothetical protein
MRATESLTRRTLACVLLAVLLAGVTLFRLGDTPPGLYLDEVAIALTARSLWENGADLTGNRLPLYPVSFFDSEKPFPINPIYIYASVPFSLAGPGAWSARMPAVLWLWAAALGIGLLAYELTLERSTAVAIGASAALTPWLFVLGRLGWEAVTFPALSAFALWALLRGARTERRPEFVLSGILFGLSLYAYSTSRLLTPLTVLALAIVFLRSATARRHGWRFAVPLLVLAIPLAAHLMAQPDLLTWRVEEEAIWTAQRESPGILHEFAANYVRYFSPAFLLGEGDPNLRHSTGRGMLLWSWIPLLLTGLWQVWRRRREAAVQAVLLGLLIAPAGASIMTTGQPHAIRSFSAVIFWSGIAALGLHRLVQLAGARRVLAAFGVVAALEIGLFLHDYFGDYRNRAFDHFDGGRDAVLREAFRHRGGRPLIVPGGLHADRHYSVFLAYWGRLPTASWSPEFLDGIGIHAWRAEWPPGSLVVLDPGEPVVPPPPAARLLHAVLDPQGETRYRLFDLR